MAKAKKTQEVIEEEVVETEAPAQTFGITELLDEIESETGKAYQPASIRVLLRKLVAEGTIERGEGRWAFDGPNDPSVVAIIDAVTKGRADKPKPEEAEEEEVEEAPAKKAPAKKAAASKAPAKKTRTKKAAEPVIEDEDDDLDLEDLDDL